MQLHAPLLGVALLVCCSATTLRAQQFKVTPGADLAFGTVIVSVPVTIQPGQPGSGTYTITGPKNKTVRLVFTLPTTLSGGAALPINFNPDAAGYSQSSSGTSMQLFDPRVPVTITLNNNGTGYVFIGGTVQPASNQPPGRYTASILLNVSAP